MKKVTFNWLKSFCVLQFLAFISSQNNQRYQTLLEDVVTSLTDTECFWAAFRCWMSGCKLREEFLAQRLSSGKLKINMSAEKCFHSSIWFTESSELSDELPDISHYSWCLMQRLLPCWFYCLVKCYLMCVFVSRFWQYSEIKSNTAFNSLQEEEIKLIICENHTHTQMLIVFVWWVNNSVYQRDSGQVSVQLSNRTGRPVN